MYMIFFIAGSFSTFSTFVKLLVKAELQEVWRGEGEGERETCARGIRLGSTGGKGVVMLVS